MKATAQNGFTLYELLVTLLVAGIVFGLGVPNFMEFQRNGAMSAAANSLVTGVLMARAEAVKRQVPVTLCASPNPTAANPTCSPNGAGANGGFIVWVDESGPLDANGVPIIGGTDGDAVVNPGETVLLQTPAPGGTMNVWADTGYISYGASGFKRRATGQALNSANWVLYCDDRGNRASSGELSAARAVRIEQSGRGQVYQEIVGVATALAFITGAGVPAVCP